MTKKKIEGFGGRYSITITAQIWCSRKKRYISICCSSGRLSARLVDEKGKQSAYSVPKLMANTFLEKREQGQKVGFKDGNLTNAHLNNLFWTKREVKQKPVQEKPIRVTRAKKYRRNKIYKIYFGMSNFMDDDIQVIIPQCLDSESEYHKAINEKDTYKSNVAFFKALCAGEI
jgi:hypothetical protein